MTAPMRRFLLNRQIALEARRIAHAATNSCNRHDERTGVPGDVDDEHTGACNKLKRAIETLALNVKLAGLQSKVRPAEEPPPLFEQEAGE